MSDRPSELARMPSWAEATSPWPGPWCRACYGTRWWTERRDPKGWQCLTCHPPVHLPAGAVRREGEGEAVLHGDADPLFRRAGLSLDEEG